MSSDEHIFKLRWESTGDKWWYASPIDWAAANGLYDLVRELLRLDGNHLIQLTSLRRTRRLEDVWDDNDDQEKFHGVAKSRCEVAKKLLEECELPKKGKESASLIGGGYGGWLLYTAASAGDLGFVKQLLDRDPLLVFGEGEYGVTDILYAAARSKNVDVFRVVYDYATSPRFLTGGGGREASEQNVVGEIPLSFKREVLNRALHAAARGGNLVALKELLGDCGKALEYKDVHGSTILHSAAGKGQVEVVNFLVQSFDVISSKDDDGNTALHIAALRGRVTVVKALIHASSSSVSHQNKNGETFLHAVVTGFKTPGFRRLDRQIELMKQLVDGKIFRIEEIINAKNNEGRTALHLAIILNVHSSLIELLLTARCIDMNIADDHGLTPLDYLKQHPQSSSSEVLIRQMISAGGISSSQDYSARKALASHIRSQSTCVSPGSSFKLSDTKIFLHTGVRHSSTSIADHRVKIRHLSTASEISHCDSTAGDGGDAQDKKPSSFDSTAKRIRTMFHWPMMKKRTPGGHKSFDGSVESVMKFSPEKAPIPLRQRFSNAKSPSSYKRTLAVRSNTSSPPNRKKFASGVVNGVMHDLPVIKIPARSSWSSFSMTLHSPHQSVDKGKGVVVLEDEVAGPSCSNQTFSHDDDSPVLVPKRGSLSRRSVYLCFGGRRLSVKGSFAKQQMNHNGPASHLVAAVA